LYLHRSFKTRSPPLLLTRRNRAGMLLMRGMMFSRTVRTNSPPFPVWEAGIPTHRLIVPHGVTTPERAYYSHSSPPNHLAGPEGSGRIVDRRKKSADTSVRFALTNLQRNT